MHADFLAGRVHKADLLELGAVGWQGLLLALSRQDRAPGEQGPGVTRPVLLVHGWQSSKAGLVSIKASLLLAGFDRIFEFGYEARQGLRAAAHGLAERIEQVHRACGGRQTLDIVAHGTGGLLARHAAQALGCASRLDRLITLACPHYGSLSPFWRLTPLGLDLHPDSEFVRALKRGEPKAAGLRYASLWSQRDLLILPQENGRFLGGEALAVTDAGHSGLLLHRPSLRWIVQRLAQGQSLPRSRRRRWLRLAKTLKQR